MNHSIESTRGTRVDPSSIITLLIMGLELLDLRLWCGISMANLTTKMLLFSKYATAIPTNQKFYCF